MRRKETWRSIPIVPFQLRPEETCLVLKVKLEPSHQVRARRHTRRLALLRSEKDHSSRHLVCPTLCCRYIYQVLSTPALWVRTLGLAITCPRGPVWPSRDSQQCSFLFATLLPRTEPPDFVGMSCQAALIPKAPTLHFCESLEVKQAGETTCTRATHPHVTTQGPPQALRGSWKSVRSVLEMVVIHRCWVGPRSTGLSSVQPALW